MKKLISTILILGLSIPTLTFAPKTVEAATKTIRQEINITDAYMYAGSGATATSSAIANLDSTRYSGATYYFEVVASTTAGTNATVLLKNATSSATIATANVTGGNVYTRYRSSSFTAPGVATDYVVALGGESIGKGIVASRIVILQSTDPLSDTQTQIEIGTATTTLKNTATAALPSTKYWKYDSSKWDPAPTFYAEVTYNTSELVASSTVYNTSGTRTYIVSSTTKYAVIEAWGGGGGGGVISNAGGGGGGGGAYARSTTSPTVGSSHTLVIGIGGTIDNGAAGTNSTYDTTTVVAAFGAGTNGNAGALGGTVANSTGDVEFKGGDGKNGETTIDLGGGGGGAAGPNGAGKDGTAATATVPGAGGDGNNSIGGGTGGPGGTTNTDTCATSDGTSGTSAATGGGGGGGAGSDGTGTCTGGDGGVPGGGGGGSDNGASRQGGANGQIKITEWGGYVGVALEESDGTGDGFTGWAFKTMIVTRGQATTTPTRVRSSAFTPTTGRNYRIVASSTQSALTYSVYNAKIVIDQSLNTFSAGSNVFADTFTRANSTTVGNGWSEISVLAADAQISSNRLNFSSATDIAAVYRAGSAFSNIITTFKFNKASASDDNWTFQIRRDNTTRGQGANSLGLTVNTLTGAYTITDSGTTKSSGTIPGAPFSSGTQYSFEWVITSTNYMELRYWLTATESRPDVASATVPAFSVVTTTTNWGFVGMNNSSFADLSIDNLTTTGGTITKLEPQYLLSSVASNQASIDNSYSETNVNVGHTVNNVEISGQCFTSSGGVLRSAIFALNRTGSPTGNAFAKIYATTGSVGTTCVPTGGVLATSNGVDISTVVTTAGVYELKTFTFGGANNITLSGSTAYAVVLVYPTGDGSNYINLGGDDTASTHAGNRVGSGDAGANWFNSATQDEAFYTYVSANPPIPSSKTLWDSSEWNTTNAYIHEVDAADGSASSATIIDSGSVVVTNSTVTSPDNVGYSSSLCMPSTGDLGVNFPTNYGDITATRILVQVGGTEASCGPAAIIIAPSRLKIIKGFLNIQAGKLQIR